MACRLVNRLDSFFEEGQDVGGAQVEARVTPAADGGDLEGEGVEVGGK